MTEQEESAPVEISLGQQLKSAREAAGMTAQGVAEQLNLKHSIIEAIDADRFDDKLSPTFTRGYLRSYARLVNADVDAILAQFDRLDVAQQQYFKMQSFSQRTNTEAHNSMLTWISGLIAVVLMSLFVIWWYQNEQSTVDEPAATMGSMESTPEAAPAVDNAAPVVETAMSDDMPVAETETPAVVMDEVAEAEAAVETPVENGAADTAPVDEAPVSEEPPVTTDELTIAESPAAALIAEETDPMAGKVSLEFTFEGDCWVKVIDATNEVLAIGIKRSGKHMPLMGVAPFEVILGAPQVVKIRYQGEELDTSGFRQGQTARFKVPLEKQQG